MFAPCGQCMQVEAGELVRVCVEYVKSGLSVVEAQCKAGQQYRYMCHRRGVTLSTPAECGESDFSLSLPDGVPVSLSVSLSFSVSACRCLSLSLSVSLCLSPLSLSLSLPSP